MTGCISTEPGHICHKETKRHIGKAHSKTERQKYENMDNNDRIYKYNKYLNNNKNKQIFNKKAQNGIFQILIHCFLIF